MFIHSTCSKPSVVFPTEGEASSKVAIPSRVTWARTEWLMAFPPPLTGLGPAWCYQWAVSEGPGGEDLRFLASQRIGQRHTDCNSLVKSEKAGKTAPPRNGGLGSEQGGLRAVPEAQGHQSLGSDG
jgi:hypothetical protein